jgi:AcrR family transcriptional regulator
VSTSNSARSTRDAILDAAERVVTNRGAGVTLEQVAEEAGVSRQTVYVHFGSRTGLLIAMVQHMDESGVLHGLVRRVFDAPTPLDSLDAVVNVHAEYHPLAYPVARVFMAGRHEDEAIGAAWDERMASRRNLYHGVVEWLHRDGLLSSEWDIETATDVLWGLTSWQLWEELVVDRGWSKDDYLRHLRTVLRRTLVGDEGAER